MHGTKIERSFTRSDFSNIWKDKKLPVNVCFKQDGATPLYALNVRTFLNGTKNLSNRYIAPTISRFKSLRFSP